MSRTQILHLDIYIYIYIYIYINKINSTNQNKQKERFFILIAKGKKKRFFLSGLDSKSSEAQYNKEPGLDSVPAHIHLSG